MCCELWLLTWRSMPASPFDSPSRPAPSLKSLGFWSSLGSWCPPLPLHLPGPPHSLCDLPRLGFPDGGPRAPVALSGGRLPVAPACTNGVW